VQNFIKIESKLRPYGVFTDGMTEKQNDRMT